jgi:GT2 family glycosyltransferase
VKARYLGEPVTTLAARIDRIAWKCGAVPILIAMSPCHGDAEVQRLVAQEMTSVPLLVDPKGLCEVAACIARSQLYVGSSLHGTITALSFKTPAVAVADELAAGFMKFSGFLEQVGLTEILCKSWATAEGCIDRSPQINYRNRTLELALAMLDEHWMRIESVVLKPGTGSAKSLSGCVSRQVVEHSVKPDNINDRGAVLREPELLQSRARSGQRAEADVVSEGMLEWIRKAYFPSIDLIVCVHNALANVELCLDSIRRNTGVAHQLYIVNDGSEGKTSGYLKEFSVAHNSVVLENNVSLGYAKAANRALRESVGEYVVLLNSDTVVPCRWVERLLECLESDRNVGIVGPLSNAAGWQSVPRVFDDDGDWMVNQLPKGVTADTAATMVESVSLRRYPDVPFLNGFCLLMKRTVIEQIGYFDEKAFPDGYGEEVDFCLRAGRAGFGMAVADHAYIFHFKSRSYGHTRRRRLASLARLSLERSYGETLSIAREKLRSSAVLAEVRRRIGEKFDAMLPKVNV